MDKKSKVCPVCGYDGVETQTFHDPEALFVVCPVCGRFENAIENGVFPQIDKSRLASFLYYNAFRMKKELSIEYRYHTTRSKEYCDMYTAEFKKGNNIHGHPVHIDAEIVDAWYPRRFSDKVDMMLIKLDELTEYIGQEIELNLQELYSLLFVNRFFETDRGEAVERSEQEKNKQALYFVNYLIECGYVNCAPVIKGNMTFGPISITPAGYQRIDELQRNVSDGREALVAMEFRDYTIKLREAIRQGIMDAGYNPVLIDEVEHNELITPELLKHIRESRFVVAELTHHNNGAYFEEGYAMGIGKPVIQLCKHGTQLHFDIAQKNTVMWDKEEDIPLRLKNRILASID